MNRRDFAKLLPFSCILRGLAGHAQTRQTVRRLGSLLLLVEDDLGRSRLAGFQQALREFGWISGENVQMDVRWAGDDTAKAQAYAADLVRAKPDAIFAHGTASVAALMQATRTIPIVFVQVTDPVEAGFVKNVSTPDGNVTGFTNFGASVGGERLRVLKEMAPQLRRALIVREADNFNQSRQLKAIEEKAVTLGIQLSGQGMKDATQLERDIADFAVSRNGGLIAIQGPFTNVHRERIVSFAAQYRLPAVYPFASFAEVGGLVSYGVNVPALWKAAAGYIDRILRGSKPGELPVREPEEPEIVVNLKTAKALNLTIPSSLRSLITTQIE